MAATFISALVIKHNNDVYLTSDLVVGVTMSIPTPGAGGVIDGDYWAVPISNYGIVTGFDFEPTTPANTTEPTPQSFHVFRLISRFGNDVWYVRGSTTVDGESPANDGYIEAAADAECCDATPRTLPTDVPVLMGCQEACEWNADSNYFFIVGIPTDAGSYTATGYLNGEALTNATGATPAALVSSMNSLWTNQGSPQIAITWTLSNGVAIGVITDGNGDDVLCAAVISA
jgi:hypothetical protein